MNGWSRLLPYRPAALLALLVVALALVGCRNQTPPAPTATPEPTATPTPDPRVLLAESAEAMMALEYVRFALSRSGGPVYLDLGLPEPVTFNVAYGNYQRPDNTQARINISAFGTNIEVVTVALGDRQWLSDPLTQLWQELPGELSFNPAIIFDKQVGWTALFGKDVQEATFGDEVLINQRPHRQIDVVLSGERVRTVTAGLADDDQVAASLWIDPETKRVAQIRFATAPADGSDPANWLLLFDNYDVPVRFAQPEAGQKANLESDR